MLKKRHVTMRLTVMGQLVKGLAVRPKTGNKSLTPGLGALANVTDLEKQLDSLIWNLWHGNVFHALQRIEDIEDDLGTMDENPPSKKKLLKAIREFDSNIRSNQAFIPN